MRWFLLLALVALAVGLFAGCDSGNEEDMAYTYLSTDNLSPGSVLRVDGAAEEVVFTRDAGPLTSFVFDGPAVGSASAYDWLYYTNARDGRRIWRADNSVVFEHTTFVRDLAIGPGGALYFSESYGAGNDGKIYRLSSAGSASLYYTVPIAAVGFWAGNFTFASDGTLYISSGNTSDASVYRCPLSGVPTVVYHRTDGGSILGLDFTDRDTFLFTDGTTVLRRARVHAATAQTVFTSPAANGYRDVLVSTDLLPRN